MPQPEMIELKLTRQEAHVLLRALASHNADDANRGDRQPCTWVAERLLRILSPDLGPQPLAAILGGDAPVGSRADRTEPQGCGPAKTAVGVARREPLIPLEHET